MFSLPVRTWFLPYLGYPQVDREEAAAGAELMADNLVRIRDAAAEYGGQYCYVAVPNQYVYGAEAYPSYMDSRFQNRIVLPFIVLPPRQN